MSQDSCSLQNSGDILVNNINHKDSAYLGLKPQIPIENGHYFWELTKPYNLLVLEFYTSL